MVAAQGSRGLGERGAKVLWGAEAKSVRRFGATHRLLQRQRDNKTYIESSQLLSFCRSLLGVALCHALAIDIAPVYQSATSLDSNKWANVQTSVGFGSYREKF